MGFELAENIKISDKEYRLLADLVYQRSGISLGDNKKELVKARLAKRIRFNNFKSFKEYYEYVIGDARGEELVQMLDAISTNVTSFFREKQHFDFLSRVVVPEIAERKKKKGLKSLRVWSAASSSGEEIYTLIMTLLECGEYLSGWDIKVLGTDISTKALAAANAGVYYADKVKGIPPMFLDKYFTREFSGEEKCYKVSSELKRRAFFGRLNLMDPVFPFKYKFDVIFCRNVMIYFDKETQHQLVNKFSKYLDANGYLFIGHSESLIGMKVDFKNISPAVFKKL